MPRVLTGISLRSESVCIRLIEALNIQNRRYIYADNERYSADSRGSTK